jgi:hypothetical protein
MNKKIFNPVLKTALNSQTKLSIGTPATPNK